jgi:hypothetical protein
MYKPSWSSLSHLPSLLQVSSKPILSSLSHLLGLQVRHLHCLVFQWGLVLVEHPCLALTPLGRLRASLV